ncbi:cytochrome P-450 cyp509A1 [Gongronella butleri]|nr:cytochrome P-450 cyp509A1 [Gongronella butleri]
MPLAQISKLPALQGVFQAFGYLTSTRAKRISLVAAFVAAVLARAVYKISVPPKNLRHLPHVGFLTIFYKFVIARESTYELSKTIAMPLLEQGNGVYLRYEPRSGWLVVCANETSVKTVFMKSDLFPKVDMDQFNGTLFNRLVSTSNILLVNGHEWKKHRKLANPAFHRSMPVKTFFNMAVEFFDTLSKRHPGETFTIDFGKYMECITLDIIGLAGFDFRFDATKDANSRWKKVYDKLMKDLRNPFFGLIPFFETHTLRFFPERVKAHQNLDVFLNMLEEIIDHKRKVLRENAESGVEEHEKDLLSLMLESELRGEGVLTQEELMGDLAIFFVAGHDTTSNALCSAVYWLARRPDIQQKARDEAIKILGDEPEDRLPTLEDTKEMTYLNMVIKETLRMHASVVALVTPRVAAQDVELAGYPIPKGTKVTVSMYDLHRNPAVWDNPDHFDPERWVPGGEADIKGANGMVWSPFANGSRQCIGMNFSLVEQRVLLACMLRRYEFSLPEDSIHKDMLITGNALITAPIDLKIQLRRRF